MPGILNNPLRSSAVRGFKRRTSQWSGTSVSTSSDSWSSSSSHRQGSSCSSNNGSSPEQSPNSSRRVSSNVSLWGAELPKSEDTWGFFVDFDDDSF
eukprot:CAMPEP_0198142404 /NCGR_PEP_ID=MMETSP1443-20131203/5201_1 /TAXON_ID=186043 /ORGANISM="Entomoneis sp., Strain CCMP2396" /LENGTH=95 /DNA_ID=CAMNT_0043805399 /DNA_START=76 /DNA_END=363 /DNA_ORIENTATION=+